MDSNNNATAENLGLVLGQQAYERAKEHASHICGWRKRHIEKSNAAEQARLKVRLVSLIEQADELRERLKSRPPEGSAVLRKRRICLYLFVTLLCLASIFFAHLSLAPFGLGWELWILCLGFGIVVPRSTARTLEIFNGKCLLRTLAVTALAASLAGILVLAILRGEVFALYLRTYISAADPSSTELGAGFYQGTIGWMIVLFGLLAVGMELEAGLDLYEARQLALIDDGETKRIRQQLDEIEAESANIAGRLTELANAPDVFESDLMWNFELGMLRALRRSGLITTISVCLFLGLLQSTSLAAEPTVVVGVDLTRSIAAVGYDGSTEYEKNLAGLDRMISGLPSGTQLTVLAISDQSFSKPDVLFSGALPRDKGPLQFLDQISLAKNRIRRSVRRLRDSKPPRFPQSDILGFLVFAADSLQQAPRTERSLVLFSDMRQFTPGLDFETPDKIDASEALRATERQQLLPDLKGTDVYVQGVHASGKSVAYWLSLKQFWVEYFRSTGASLKTFSMTHDVPRIDLKSGAAVKP